MARKNNIYFFVIKNQGIVSTFIQPPNTGVSEAVVFLASFFWQFVCSQQREVFPPLVSEAMPSRVSN